jgi:uncharacterized protein (DUF362 family)/Pyruvate/2-oxoacid:ferredoxin oxidoreductase delta subunit
MQSKVVLIRCNSYDYSAVQEAVSKGISLLGGANQFVKQGEKILLKVNLLVGDDPAKCVTTHPSVFKAVAEVFQSTGAFISYGDSPGFGSPIGAAKKAGIADVATELKIPMADFQNGEEVFFENGIQNKKFNVAKGVIDADGLISLPKFKAHGLERFTGAVKNQFGCVVGMRKGEFHVKLPDASDFAKMLVDLNNYVHPRLYIMDGIVAMEGNGPRGGTPCPMNILLFSTDPVALDATACRMVNLEPTYVPTNVHGAASGAGSHISEEIEILGDDFNSFVNPKFDINRTPIVPFKKKGITTFLNNRLVAKPYIEEPKCTRCGTCINCCPVVGKAINWINEDKNLTPVYDYSKCIRCYCCQEMCPESAIELKQPILRKALRIFS